MKSTTDLWFASFLLHKGEKLKNYVKVGPRKARYEFEISEKDWKELRLQFFASEAQQIKLKQEQLKDLLY